MALMDWVNIFLNLRWFIYFWSTFFHNISQMMLPNIYSISVKIKTTKMKHNITNVHNQVAKKLIFCIPYQTFNVKMFFQITNVCYKQYRSVFTNF